MNPSIFEIKWENTGNVLWIVDNYQPYRGVIFPHKKKPKIDVAAKKQDLLALMRSMFEKGKRLYGSYYRPGEFWDQEVFVCPRCAHATASDEEHSDEYETEAYCKYCYTEWHHDPKAGWIDMTHTDDEDE